MAADATNVRCAAEAATTAPVSADVTSGGVTQKHRVRPNFLLRTSIEANPSGP